MKVNWNDPALEKWFGTISQKTTVYNYRMAFKNYAEFTGLTATQLIEEAFEDRKLHPLKRKDIMRQRLIKFYEWLITKAPKISKGKSEQVVVGKGVSARTASTRVNAVRSFYATFDITVKMKGRNKIRKGKIKNKRMIVGAEQVRTLVQHARTIRDRAIILVNFQGGLDASTICSLNYEDVAQGIESGEYPFKLELVRPKTDVEYYTFLGRDAINALEAYVANEKKVRIDKARKEAKKLKMEFDESEVQWKPESPLFTKESRGTDERITPNLVQNMMKEVVVSAGLVDHANNGKDFNILGSHALRESFSSIMLNSGVPKPTIDFWLGHTRGDMNDAYMRVQEVSAREMYSKREHLLSINVSTESDEKLRKIENSIADMHIKEEDLKAEVKDLKELVQTFVKELHELREFKDKVQSAQDFQELVAELNKERPIAKKPA